MRQRTYHRVVYDTAVQLRMTRDLREAIERAAAAQNKSFSDWLRDVAIAAVERSKRTKPRRESP